MAMSLAHAIRILREENDISSEYGKAIALVCHAAEKAPAPKDKPTQLAWRRPFG